VVRPDSKKSLTKVPEEQLTSEAQVDMPHYGTSLDVFSYGGVILHTKEWPTLSAVKQYDPKTKRVRGFTEVERRQELKSLNQWWCPV